MRTLYCWVLSKEVSSTIFKVFGMMWPGIEPRSPRPLANTLPTRPIKRSSNSLVTNSLLNYSLILKSLFSFKFLLLYDRHPWVLLDHCFETCNNKSFSHWSHNFGDGRRHLWHILSRNSLTQPIPLLVYNWFWIQSFPSLRLVAILLQERIFTLQENLTRPMRNIDKDSINYILAYEKVINLFVNLFWIQCYLLIKFITTNC